MDYQQAGPGDFYQIPKHSGEETVIEPYLYPVGGKEILITSLCVPIRVNGRVVGVAGTDIALDTIDERFSDLKLFETGYLSVISNKGLYVTHPKSERNGSVSLF